MRLLWTTQKDELSHKTQKPRKVSPRQHLVTVTQMLVVRPMCDVLNQKSPGGTRVDLLSFVESSHCIFDGWKDGPFSRRYAVFLQPGNCRAQPRCRPKHAMANEERGERRDRSSSSLALLSVSVAYLSLLPRVDSVYHTTNSS